jgi:hypothetical protein
MFITALFALAAATPRGRSSADIREPSTGALEFRWKIASFLSMRGITLFQWKFAMMAEAVSPTAAKHCSALRYTESLA